MSKVGIFTVVFNSLPKSNRDDIADSRCLKIYCNLIFERTTVGFQQDVSNFILVIYQEIGCYKQELFHALFSLTRRINWNVYWAVVLIGKSKHSPNPAAVQVTHEQSSSLHKANIAISCTLRSLKEAAYYSIIHSF